MSNRGRGLGCATGMYLAAAWLASGIAPASAQDAAGNAAGDDSLVLTMEAELRRSAALDAIAVDRPGFVEGIVGRWSGLADDGGDEIREALMELSDEGLAAADLAETPDALNQAILAPQDLGDTASDLVFFPVTPCRIIDTRNAGGILVAGVLRDFNAQGPFTGQGGDAGNCGLPGSDPAALALTVIAVTPTGPGNLRAWPTGDPLPNAVAINYTAGQNLANTTIVPLKQDGLLGNEFSAQANVSNSHLVADVVGYFWSPNATALQQSFPISAAESIAAGGTGAASSPDCPAGYVVTGGSCILGSFQMHLVTSRRQSAHWTCTAENEGGGAANLTAEAICSRIPGR